MQLINSINLKKLRNFQCRVCNYIFEMLPCNHGLRGKDLNCPKCNGKLKRIDGYDCEGDRSPEDCDICGKCDKNIIINTH